MPNNNIISENTSVDFSRVIGAPIVACINAQKEAAQATINYIKEQVFQPSSDENLVGDLEPITITFYFQSNGLMQSLVMPLICIVPVPYFQIESVDLTFQTKITESYKEYGKIENGKGKVHLQAQIASEGKSDDENTSQSEASSETNVNAYMDVCLHVTSSDMPAGISKLLEIFSNELVQITQEAKGIDQVTETPNATLGDGEKHVEQSIEPDAPEPPVAKYNIRLKENPSGQQLAKIQNITTKHSTHSLSDKDIKNLKKSKNKTIPIEEELEVAYTIQQELTSNGIASIVVNKKGEEIKIENNKNQKSNAAPTSPSTSENTSTTGNGTNKVEIQHSSSTKKTDISEDIKSGIGQILAALIARNSNEKKYDIHFLKAISNKQEPIIKGIVNKHIEPSKGITPSMLNEISKNKELTIHLDVEMNTAQKIIDELAQKKIVAEMVESKPKR